MLIKSRGYVDLEVNIGKSTPMKHRFMVLDSAEPTLILGRDYLMSRAVAVNSVLQSHENTSYWRRDWNVNPDLIRHQRSRITELLEEFSDVFATNPKKPNGTHCVEHVIETGGAYPVRVRCGRVSPQTERDINIQIEQMLDNGVIRPSTSPWASRVILIRKKDNTLRFAVDYRALNYVTRKDAYPIPKMKDILDKLHGSEYFSTLDGASAYWSIPIKETDREKTAFVSPRGEFEFCVVPFGLCNAPSTYQRMIDLALKDAPQSLPYIDDTLTFSNSFDDHLKHLRVVLQCYRSTNLQLRIDKCRFGYRETEFWDIYCQNMDTKSGLRHDHRI